MDKFTALKVYKRVVELNGFSAAARDLALSNGAVSKNINELEAYLGTRLLTRTTRRMSLTEAGKIYYQRCLRILEDLDEADAVVTGLTDAPRGLLRITAPTSLGIVKIGALIPDFLNRYPEVQIDLNLDDRVVDLIDSGYDLAIRGRSVLPDSSLVSRRLGPVVRVLCASPGYIQRYGEPVRPQDLAQHSCLIYSLSPTPNDWAFERAGKRESVRVEGPYRANNSLVIRDAAVAGLGIARLPKNYVEHLFTRGDLVELLSDWPVQEQSLYAIYPSSRHMSPKLRAFVDFLVTAFEE